MSSLSSKKAVKLREEELDHLPIAMTLPIGNQAYLQGRPRIHEVAGVGTILEHEVLPDDRYHILLVRLARIRIDHEIDLGTTYRQVKAILEPSYVESDKGVASMLRSVRSLTFAIRPMKPKVAAELVRIADEGNAEAVATARRIVLSRPPASTGDPRGTQRRSPAVRRGGAHGPIARVAPSRSEQRRQVRQMMQRGAPQPVRPGRGRS